MFKVAAKWCGAVVTPVVAVAILAALSTSPAQAKHDPNPAVFPPDAKMYGKTYSQWADSWWQWVDGIPKSASPLIDPTGADCAEGQSGPVWFLAGSPTGSYERSCTIPKNKALFLPVSNFQEDQREAVPDYAFFGSVDCPGVYGSDFCDTAYDLLSPDPTDPAAMLAFINFVTDSFIDIGAKYATIDGEPVADLADYRAPSGPKGYKIRLPRTDDPLDNYHTIFGYAFPGPDTYHGVQDGYYLMLSPLSKGEHTVSFGEAPDWAITYHLTVK